MTKTLKIAAGLLLVIFTFTACRTQQKINRNYFTQDQRDSSHSRLWQDYQIKIQKRDRLSIYVTALNPQSAQIFNIAGATSTGTAGGGAQGYAVDENGRILFPQLGFIHVEGYTRNQLRDTLIARLSTYLTDPVVTVDFANLKVTVLGEVVRQGPLRITDGKITLLEALGEAGDISPTGRRDSILVIREENNQRQFGYINLLSNEAFKSPYFMLQQNDVVYVPMVKSRAYSTDKPDETFLQKSLPYITALTSLSSLVWLIYSITR